MDMKKLLSFCVIASSFLTTAYAATFTQDACTNIPGHWHGVYTIKDQEACKLYNGCTHLVMADASHVAGNEYHISLNPVVGQGGEFNITCDNGVITSPVNPGSSASVSCTSSTHCVLQYDDPRLTSEMMKG